MKYLIFLIVLMGCAPVLAQTKISALPLLGPSSVGTFDAVPIQSFSGNATYRLQVSDLPATPAFVSAFATLQPVTTLGDTIFGNTFGLAQRLPGNTTTTKKFFTQTGNGSLSASPAWGTILNTDLSGITNTQLSGSAAISNANLATMSANTIKGNNTAGSATPQDLTAAQAAKLITPMTTGGDLEYLSSGGVVSRLGNGNNLQVLTSQGGTNAPVWADVHPVSILPTRQIFRPEGTTTTGNLSSSSACITSPANLNAINVGAGVTDSTTAGNITNGTYVVALPGTCSAGQIQMSANAAGSATGDTLVFGANKSTTATTTSSSVCLSSVGSTAGIAPGAFIYDVTNPSGKVAVNAVVVGIATGGCTAGQIQMSAAALAAATGDTMVFSGGQYTRPSSSVLYLKVVGVAGGGGGGAGNGQPTYFGSTTLLAATGGIGNAGAGGTASSTLTNSPLLLAGGSGTGGFPIFANGGPNGGQGGSSALGGGGGGGAVSGAGQNGAANTGGGGGGNGSGVGGTSAGGGAAGGYFNGIITSPSSTYPFFPGSGGVGSGGGNGGTGVVIVEEFYQ